MGYNRSGVKFVAKMKRRRREAARLAKRASESTVPGATATAATAEKKIGKLS